MARFNNVGVNPIVKYVPTFSATGLTFTGDNSTYPTYNSSYVKAGNLVTFAVEVDLSTVTNFGTGQYKLELPFNPYFAYNHFAGWVHLDKTIPADSSNHIILNVDHVNTNKTLDLHYLVAAPAEPKPIIENIFKQGFPYTLTTNSKIYINGTYICQS